MSDMRGQGCLCQTCGLRCLCCIKYGRSGHGRRERQKIHRGRPRILHVPPANSVSASYFWNLAHVVIRFSCAKEMSVGNEIPRVSVNSNAIDKALFAAQVISQNPPGTRSLTYSVQVLISKYSSAYCESRYCGYYRIRHSRSIHLAQQHPHPELDNCEQLRVRCRWMAH